ncbi:MAG: glycine--tRNA ligase [archaeon]
MNSKEFLKEFQAFLSDKGFIYGPEPEIYGGIAGFYTYGPLGKKLKNRLENTLRIEFEKKGFWEIETPIIVPEIVWKASGHLDSFNDPIILCGKCKASFNAEKLIEELIKENAGGLKDQELLEKIKSNNLKCPSCKGNFEDKIERHSLMMKTTIGLNTTTFNRPETATVTYLPFKRYEKFFRDKLPFSVFQIGKSFRNEIAPRQLTVRGREFTQAEAQIFLTKKMKENWPEFEKIKETKLPLIPAVNQKEDKMEVSNLTVNDALNKKLFSSKAYAWTVWFAFNLFKEIGFEDKDLRLRQHKEDEKAFYALSAWDLEIKFRSYGWIECCGIHDRGDYDLKQHEKFSKTKLQVKDEEGKDFTPQVLEIAFGTDRPLLALLDKAFEKRIEDEKRILLKLPLKLTPIDIAILPLVNKDGVKEKALEVFEKLNCCYKTVFDDSGSIGRRYARQDSIGTAFCITIDYESKKNDDVTLRHRDSMKQERIKISELQNLIFKKIYCE